MPANSNNCPVNKIDSNVVGANYAEEECIGVLPDAVAGSGDQAGGVWRPLNPNEFDDFGAEISTTAIEPITADRQENKGPVTDLEASGGINQDVTHYALQRPLQGFFFADARERPNSAPLSDLDAPLITLTSVGPNTITLGTGGGAKLKAGDILMLSGMTNPGNNQADLIVTAIAGDVVTVTSDTAIVAEVGSALNRVEVVGFQFDNGDLSIEFSGTERLTLNRIAGDFTTEGYSVGEWVYINQDDDNGLIGFISNGGYARIEKIEPLELTLKEPTWLPVAEAVIDKARIYLGTFIRNENEPSLIKRRSYNIERTLGQDNDGIQSEYLIGCVADEFNLNLSTADKMQADLSFMALDNETRTGLEGLKPGDRSEQLKIEDVFNTSSNVFQLRLFITDPLKASPSSIYTKVMEASLQIANGATGNKAIGDLGAFDITVGNFVVTGEIEAYFSTVEAIRAVKQNRDVGFNMIATKNNTGFVYDIPLLSLSGGKLNIEKDEAIKIPLEKKGAKNHMGFTLGATFFNYLPTEAMANAE